MERHWDILQRLKKVVEANNGLSSALSVTPNLAQIETQAGVVIEALNHSLRAVNDANPDMTWDGVILGSLKFIEAMLLLAQAQLEEALNGYEGDEEQETVH